MLEHGNWSIAGLNGLLSCYRAMGVCKFADNKADARGFFAKLSESMKIRRGPRTEEDDEVSNVAPTQS